MKPSGKPSRNILFLLLFFGFMSALSGFTRSVAPLTHGQIDFFFVLLFGSIFSLLKFIFIRSQISLILSCCIGLIFFLRLLSIRSFLFPILIILIGLYLDKSLRSQSQCHPPTSGIMDKLHLKKLL